MHYITSDLHFLHKNILRFCAETRPWGSVEEMNDALVGAINGLPDCEMLYHNGDFLLGNPNKLPAILERIKVPMTLVRGNHDSDKAFRLAEAYGHRTTEYLEMIHGDRKVVMFHYPIYREWRNAHRGAVHFYGHVHDLDIGSNGKSLNVCWDRHGRILTLDEAIEMADRNPIETFTQ